MLDLSHVRAFVAVAEEAHFGRAALRLNLSPSPLSRQVRMLEDALGVRLLERSTRSVRLTPGGQTFLGEAYRVLDAVGAAERLTRRVAQGEAGSIRLGFTAATAYRVLPRIVAELHKTLPALELVLEEMVTAAQMEALAERRLDLGLLRPPAVLPGERLGLAFAPVLRERMLLAVPSGHSLAAGRVPSLQDLDGQPFVNWSPQGGSYFLDLLAGVFRRSGVAPRTVQRVNQTHAMLALVGAGIGLALVPESARVARPAGVVLRPFALPGSIQAEQMLAWREDNDNPSLGAVRGLVLRLFADASAGSCQGSRQRSGAA